MVLVAAFAANAAHATRERGRTDEVREHHGDLAALGGVLWRGGRCSRNGGLRSTFLRPVSSAIARSS